MNRIVPYLLLPLIAAAVALFALVYFALENLMRPAWPQATTIAWYAAFVVIVAGVMLAMRQIETGRRWVLAGALALILAAGFLPQVVDVFAVQEQIAEDQAAGADIEMTFQSQLMDWRDAVAEHTDAGTAWTAEEAMPFLDFAASSDLSWHSLPDHTPEAYALVNEALAASVLDPDALVTPPVPDSPPATLTLAWYDARIRPGSPNRIERRPWEVLQLLVAGGADLASDDAAELRADLAKTVVPVGDRFLSLTWGADEPDPASALDAATDLATGALGEPSGPVEPSASTPALAPTPEPGPTPTPLAP